MSWQPTVFTAIGVGAAGISAAVAVDAWRHRSEPIALPFVALMANLSLWSLVYGIQLGFTTLQGQLPWQGLTMGIAGIVPTTWLLFTIRYGGYGSWLTRPRLAALAIDPVVFFALAITNGMEGPIWTNPTLVDAGFGSVLALSFGPGYYIHIIYAYLGVAAGIGLLVLVAGQASKLYRNQVGLLLAGATPPFLSHIAYTLGLGPIRGLDLTPFVFALTGVLFGLAMFRFDLLRRVPVARERVLEEAGDGLIVVDQDGTVVDSNRIARAVFDRPPRVGVDIGDVLDRTDFWEEDGTTRTAIVDGSARSYHIRVSTLEDHHGRLRGHTLVLRDVTDLRAYEQRLEVSNRILRHNLRNDMNVVLAYAESLEATLEGDPETDARIIRQTAKRLTDLGEKVRRMMRVSGTDPGESVAIDVAAATTAIITDFIEEYPDVDITIECTEGAAALAIDRESFESAIRNLVENAIEHNEGADRRVSVVVEETPTWVQVRVSDNGPGIPEMEREVITEGAETQLRHSQGVGLWLVSWVVSASGGHLGFDVGEDGTTVTVAFPRADRPLPDPPPEQAVAETIDQ